MLSTFKSQALSACRTEQLLINAPLAKEIASSLGIPYYVTGNPTPFFVINNLFLEKNNLSVSGSRVVIKIAKEKDRYLERSLRIGRDTTPVIFEKEMSRAHYLGIKYLLTPLRQTLIAAINFVAFTALSYSIAVAIDSFVFPAFPTLAWVGISTWTIVGLFSAIVLPPIIFLSQIESTRLLNSFMRNYIFKRIDC